jgi:DMSO reductase anchor subunit
MAILGFGLVYSMAQVYRLRAVPAWNNWRTHVAFFLSTTVLGALGIHLLLPQPGWLMVAALGMLAEMGLRLTLPRPSFTRAGKLHLALLGLGVAGTLLLGAMPQAGNSWLASAVLLIALAAEVIGRWQFYTWRMPFPNLDS